MLDPNLLSRINKKKVLYDVLLPLSSVANEDIKSRIKLEWIYNSNAIEGNTLSLRETKQVLETGITIGKKSLREHLEVINHRDAIEYVERLSQQAAIPKISQVRQIHMLLLKGIDDHNAGMYRQTRVRILGAQHIPPDYPKVPRYMQSWASWLRRAGKKLHPIELAAVAHYRFVAIHPFIDGNGRTARLIMNLLLQQHGYPAAVILNKYKSQYYQVLSQAECGTIEPLVNYVGRAVENSLLLFITE